MPPEVDVLIATWDRADTVGRAIRSALTQPDVKKVIVVDDASTDDTAAQAEGIAAETDRVRVLRLETNVGPSAARNRALELSSAPWVAVLDSDDYYLPGRIGKLLSVAEQADFVADDVVQIDETKIGSAEPQPILNLATTEMPRCLQFEEFVRGNVARRGKYRKELGFLKPLMRRSFLDCHGLHYEEELRLGEDYALYAHALGVGARFLLVPACGYVSVMRANSLSGSHTKKDLERLRDFDIRLGTILDLLPADQLALRSHYRSVDARVQWLAVIDAFKARNIRDFLVPFGRSPAVSLFIAEKLFEELRTRSGRWLNRQTIKRNPKRSEL
jgi:succinoglycan biosynthesis protein ExoU